MQRRYWVRPHIRIDKEFNLKKIKFDLSKELNRGGFIVRQDHIDRLDRGLGVDGRGMTPLKPNTVAGKGHNKILVDSDKMRRLNVKKATPQKQILTISPGDKRKYSGTSVTQKDVGRFHQFGTSPYTITPRKAKFLRFETRSGVVYTKKVNHPGLPKREWFGISKTAERRVLKMVEDRIERELIRA